MLIPITHQKNLAYPIRINRFLALHKITTRPEADELIKKGEVTINGRKAVLGDKIEARDIVKVKTNPKAQTKVYYAYNKPIGVVTNNPQNDEIEIIKNLRFPEKVFAVGRLDKESHGLIIMTNDGRITDALLNPKKDHEKEYVVEVDKPIKGFDLSKMEKGLRLDTFTTKPCVATKIGNTEFRVVLTEGKNHQLRRMCDNLGYVVRDLKRTRVMNIELGKLKPNTFREITGKELEIFLKSLGF